MKTSNDIRQAAFQVLETLFDPMADFALQAGLSVSECQAAFHGAAIKSSITSQIKSGSRINISGIAASTGLTRSEIAKFIKSTPKARLPQRKTPSAKLTVLSIWRSAAKFTSLTGKPLELNVYGQGSTFDSLVKKYGRGIPTRALLDELLRTGIAEILPGQVVRLNVSASERKQFSLRGVRQSSVRASEIISILLKNIADSESEALFTDLRAHDLDPGAAKLFQSVCKVKATNFLADIDEALARISPKKKLDTEAKSVSTNILVSISSNLLVSEPTGKTHVIRRRRNLRRADRTQGPSRRGS